MGELLTEAGAEEFDLTHVERLGEAVQRLREGHFDVVLLDLSLPDSNGLDTVSGSRRQSLTFRSWC